MGISIGNNTIGSLYLGSTKIGAAYFGNVKMYESSPLPSAKTVRMTFANGYTPTVSTGTLVQVSSSPNVWDYTFSGTSYNLELLSIKNSIVSVVVNAEGMSTFEEVFPSTNIVSAVVYVGSTVTSLQRLIEGSRNLTSISFQNVGANLSNISYVCSNCTALTSVPMFDTSHLTNVSWAFNECNAVQSGSLDLYQQMSSQTNPPANHDGCFYMCGINGGSQAVSDLGNIPGDWGGAGPYPE